MISLLNRAHMFGIIQIPSKGGPRYEIRNLRKRLQRQRFIVTLEGGTYTTDMTVVYRSQTYRAEASSDSPFDNIDLVIPRLLGQIRKQKDIWGKTKRGSENIYEEEED